MHSAPSFKPQVSFLTQDRSNSLSNGLIGAWLFNQVGYRVINNYASINIQGKATAQTTPVWTGSPWGAALKFDATNSDYWTILHYPGFKPTTYPFSVAARVKFPNANCAFWTNDDALNKYAGITLVQSGGIFTLRLGDAGTIGSTHRKDMLTSAAVSYDTWVSVVFNVYSISSFETYTNGLINTGSTTGTATTLAYSSATANGSMGREDVSALGAEYYSTHEVDYVYFWTGRFLSAQDVLELSIDPYKMFERHNSPYFYMPAGWRHKINGVSNSSINKICGVSKTFTSKVNSVA